MIAVKYIYNQPTYLALYIQTAVHDLPRALLIERYLGVDGSSLSTNYAIIPTLFSLLFGIPLSLNLVFITQFQSTVNLM